MTRVLVDLLRERELHEDPGHALVGVQLGDEREQLVLRGLGRELVVERLDAGLATGLLLVPDVDRRRGILADEHRRETDRPIELGDLAADLLAHALGERLPVHERGSHGRRA